MFNMRILCNNTGREQVLEEQVGRMMDTETLVLLQDVSQLLLERVDTSQHEAILLHQEPCCQDQSQDSDRQEHQCKRLRLELKTGDQEGAAPRRFQEEDNVVLVPRAKFAVAAVHRYATECGGASVLGVSLVERASRKRYLVCSLYFRPRVSCVALRALLEWLATMAAENEGMRRALLMGDTNAANIWWERAANIFFNRDTSERHYRKVKELRGRQVVSFAKRHKLACLNASVARGSTCMNDTCVDLALVGRGLAAEGLTNLRLVSAKTTLGNSHKILDLRRRDTACGRRSLMGKRVTAYERLEDTMLLEFKLASEEVIQRGYYQASRAQQRLALDYMVEMLYQTLERAQAELTSVDRTRRLQVGGAGSLALNRRRRAQRKLGRVYARMNHGSASWVSDVRQHRRMLARVRELRSRIQVGTRAKTGKGATHPSSVWDRIGARYKYGGDQDEDDQVRKIYTKSELDRIARLKFPATGGGKHSNPQVQSDDDREGPRISDAEIACALKDLAGKRFRCARGISMRTFNSALRFVLSEVKFIVRESFRLLHVPRPCELTRGSLVPKRDATKFRIVHVSNTMSALMEVVALHRLEHKLATPTRGLLSPSQFGFTALRDRHALVARMVELIACDAWGPLAVAKSVEAARLTTLVSLDLEGAFDNVSQAALVAKLTRELPDAEGEHLALWLARFITSRRVVLVANGVVSRERRVQAGVPQGSPLGPALFNFATKDVAAGVELACAREVLAYADDLYVVQKGCDPRALQAALNRLVENLRHLGLRVNHAKSHAMVVRYGVENSNINTRRKYSNKFRVEGEPLRLVKSMNVLGMHMTWRMALDRERTRDLARRALEQLSAIYHQDVIQDASEWRQVIESLLSSRLVVNAWPLLVADPSARAWVDNLCCKVLKLVFNWPTNITAKCVRLLSKQSGCLRYVARMVRLGATGEMASTYALLAKLLARSVRGTSRREYSQLMGHMPRPLAEQLDLEHERYGDPTQYLDGLVVRLVEVGAKCLGALLGVKCGELAGVGERVTFVKQSCRELWVVPGEAFNSRRGSLAVELASRGQHLGRHLLVRHAHYPIAYFSSMALLWRLFGGVAADSGGEGQRVVIMDEKGSVVAALMNHRNRDWRVIRLRRLVKCNQWRILLLSKWALEAQFLSSVEVRQLASLWAANKLTAVACSQPEVGDYLARHEISMRDERERHDEMLGLRTWMCRKIAAADLEVWWRIPPSWLSGCKMLLLADLVLGAPGDKQLVKAKCAGDEERVCGFCGEAIVDVDMHPVEHRVKVCTKFAQHREDMSALADAYARDGQVSKLYANKMTCQRALKILTRCALGRD